MLRTRVKICGITRVEDGLQAAELGVDAIGLVFYPNSSRFIDIEQAIAICSALPAFVTTVGLFLDATTDQVQTVLDAVALDLLQFHGDETEEFCTQFGRPFIKAVPMRLASDVVTFAKDFPQAKALLLDSHGGGVIGGTGKRFDWSKIPAELDKPIILAGGLNADNITAAVRQVQPYAVDISSGVEVAKGIKDAQLMSRFMHNLQLTEQGMQ